MDKAKLDAASDAASIAAVATAKAYVAANQSDAALSVNAIAAGLTQASKAFVINAGSLPFSQAPNVLTYAYAAPTVANCPASSACIYLSQSKQTFTATTIYSGSTQNNFGQIFGVPTTKLAGVAAATADIPSYLDFYLLVDVSGSMGLASTSSGQASLLNNTGCQFACHFPGQDGGYNYALNNAIQLRSGAVNTAVCGLLKLAASPSVTQQYRVGIYPFIDSTATLAPLTYADTNAASLSAAAGCSSSNPTVFTQLLDTGTTQLFTGNDPSTGTGSGGTHFESALSTAYSTISSFGDGSSSLKSRPFVFIITDGMQNNQHFYSSVYGRTNYPGNPSSFRGYANANWDGSSPQTMNSSLCSALKNATPNAATISILYIPYSTLTVTNQNTGETVAANTAVPNIPSSLTACATSGFFYTANAPADISNALGNMFRQAVQVAHLKQ